MVETDKDYYQHRASIEIERARAATMPRVADIHHQLAEAYRDKLVTPTRGSMTTS